MLKQQQIFKQVLLSRTVLTKTSIVCSWNYGNDDKLTWNRYKYCTMQHSHCSTPSVKAWHSASGAHWECQRKMRTGMMATNKFMNQFIQFQDKWNYLKTTITPRGISDTKSISLIRLSVSINPTVAVTYIFEKRSISFFCI